MIEIKDLTKKYTRGKEVISGLNLTFGDVGLNIVVGKSGCGKTTLINILGGMDLDFSGNVTVDGFEISSAKYNEIADYRNFTSSFVFQKNSLFEFLTVEENLQLCMNIQNSDSNISEALERVGLAGFEKKKVRALSGGEKQRVAIARCLIKDSKVIFADEPTSALDSKNAHKVFQLFKDLSKDHLVIVVTHDVKKASMYADRMIRLVDGNVEEDIVYNERLEKSRELKEKSSKKFSLTPIFKHNLKTGLVINLFVIILLIVAICITSIAIEQKKIKNEYDKFGTSEQFFNVDRAIKTEIVNDINMYAIAKRGNADNAYYYIEHADEDYDYNLSEGDYAFVKGNFKNYDLYEGTNDVDFQKLIIPGISNRNRMGIQDTDGIWKYWYTYSPSNFEYYVYNEDYKYDLVAGRLPKADNEILVTDTVADMYLRNRAFSPGNDYQPFYSEYIVDYNDLLNDTYIVHYTPAAAASRGKTVDDDVILENVFTIYDVYGTYTGTVGGTEQYYLYTEKNYKVVGIINTGILPYYTYNYDACRYYLLDNFETQSGTESFMNSLNYQPSGYVVLPKALGGTNENQNLQDSYAISAIKVNGVNAKNKIAAFYGAYDYTGYGLAGYQDDISINAKGRIVAPNTGFTKSKLDYDEVIISASLAASLYPNLNITQSNAYRKFDNITNRELEFTFVTNNTSVTKTLKLVGISKDFDGDMYLSDELFSELYVKQKGSNPILSINLEGVGLNNRKKIMESFYKKGYVLVPEDNMPGAYLEFVEGKGEMICEVDYEGLSSLYPYHQEETVGYAKYFMVNGVNYGQISGEYVYMKSSVIRQIALDESYYTSQGNISPYYLYSSYYNSNNELCITSSDTGNSLLEIIDGLYRFFLAVAVILAIGFICLKEFRQSSSITKLSMLGVRNKDLIILNIFTYIPMAIIILIMSLVLSGVFINVINGLYSYSFENLLLNPVFNTPLYDSSGNTVLIVTTVNRIRIMFTSSTIWISIISVISILSIMLASSIFVTLRSRK